MDLRLTTQSYSGGSWDLTYSSPLVSETEQARCPHSDQCPQWESCCSGTDSGLRRSEGCYQECWDHKSARLRYRLLVHQRYLDTGSNRRIQGWRWWRL